MDFARELLYIFQGHSKFYVKTTNLNKDAEGKVKGDTITVSEKPSAELFEKHLRGELCVGISPINERDTCFFGVLDVDFYADKSALKDIVDIVHKYNLPLVPFRSKSGGLHLYLFLTKEESATDVKAVLERIVDTLSLKEFISGKGEIEVFPLQTRLAYQKKGHTINIPFCGAYDGDGISYALDEDLKPMPIARAIEAIKATYTTTDTVNAILDDTPYSDAPPCIQKALLSGMKGKTGRNNLLFSVAVYLKKKFGEEFHDHFVEANNMLYEPLPDDELEVIYSSVKTNEYNYKCKSGICKTFCCKDICKQREFGIGRDKGHFTGMDYGTLIRMKTESPYYIWKIKIMGDTDYKDIIFQDEDELLNQKIFIKFCVRFLNHAPCRVKEEDWFNIVNIALRNVEEKEVSLDSDTSQLGTIRKQFRNFLTSNLANERTPYFIRMGFVYYKEGIYYFTHEGFTDFLNQKKVSLQGIMLREVLKSFGANEGYLRFNDGQGKPQEIACWVKEADQFLDKMRAENESDLEQDRHLLETALKLEEGGM